MFHKLLFNIIVGCCITTILSSLCLIIFCLFLIFYKIPYDIVIFGFLLVISILACIITFGLFFYALYINLFNKKIYYTNINNFESTLKVNDECKV